MRNVQGHWAELFLMLAVLFGAIVRFAPTVIAHTPINDGGMFYTMIEELKANSFMLPAYTSYNSLHIPFAYPPLSLYAGALLAGLGIPTIEILRWLPPLVSTLSILAFWWMAGLMLESRTKASVAAAIYALIPRTFSWYVMGGGLSRSFGILFLLLTCGAGWLLFTKPTWRRILLTSVLGAGAVLSHPETALHTVATCALIWVFRGRNLRGLRDALLIALGVIVVSSPWWGSVLAQHGFGPFQSALRTGAHNALFWIPWLTFNFAQEPFVTLLTVLGLIGLGMQCMCRKWFLPIWVFMPFVVEPRSAPAIAVLPLAILAAQSLTEFVIPNFAHMTSAEESSLHDWTEYLTRSSAARAVLGLVLLYASFAFALSLARAVIPADSRDAMQWVRQNTPEQATFVVLSGSSDPFSDSTAEWFPVLARRTSVNTLQGREWLLGKSFMPFLQNLSALQGCTNQAPDCVEKWAESSGLPFDYAYIEDMKDVDASTPSKVLIYELLRDADYELVFENEGAVIFQRK